MKLYNVAPIWTGVPKKIPRLRSKIFLQQIDIDEKNLFQGQNISRKSNIFMYKYRYI